MYNIAVIREGQPTTRTSCDSAGLRVAAYNLVYAGGGTITDADDAGLMVLISDAQAQADATGFAALECGAGSMTIRPRPAPATV